MFDRFITARNDDLFALPHLVKRMLEAEPQAAGINAPVDVLENDTEVRLTLEMPGLDRESLKVTVESGVLSISGEKKAGIEVGESDYFRGERRFGKFARNFTVPSRVDATNIAAKYVDGVLEVTMPKVPAAQPRKIEVK
jgi:HSP20 family protein